MALVAAGPPNIDDGRRTVSLDGIVHADRDPWLGTWVATNDLTLERIDLAFPATEDVYPVFNEDGDGVFSCDAEDEEPIVIESIMRFRAECQDGCYYLHEKNRDGDFVELGSIEQLTCHFDLGSITCEFGAMRTSQAVEVAIFERPRGSCKIFWGFLSVYKVAKFSFATGFASTWLHKNLPSWSSLLAGLEMAGSIIRSRPCGGAASSHADRPTPFVAASSKGMVSLLLSWGYSSQRWCGMKGEKNLEAVRCFLQGFLSIVRVEAWELRIFLSATVEVRWPRPWSGEHPVSLPVDANGLVSLEPLQTLAAGALRTRDPEAKFAAYFLGLHGNGDCVDLMTLLAGLAKERRHPWAMLLFVQCAHRVGERIDSIVVAMLDPKYTHPSSVLTVSAVDVSTDYRLDRTLRNYTDMSVETFSDAKFLSIAADSSRVGVQALQNAMIVDNSNRAAWLVPQVVEDYTDEVDVAEMIGGQAAAEEAMEKREKRQRAWAERSAESNPAEWRAPKRPRVATYNFIRYLDNQVFHGTGAGLIQFQQSEELDERGCAEDWPKVCLALDQHSTQLSAVAFMQRKLSINLEVSWDLAHGNWRDCICTLKEVQYWGHMLLCMVAYNTPCGPWEDDARWQQCKSAMQAMFKRTTPDKAPLFMQMLPQLVRESGSQAALSSRCPEDEMIWKELEMHSPWELKDGKVVMNRFMGARRKAEQELKHWNKRSFAYQFACLELGFFRGASFNKLAVRGELPDGAEAGGSTNARKSASLDKVVRSACANTMVVAALVYGDPDNKTRQSIFVSVTEPWDKWHSLQSRECRSVSETQEFLTQQAGGDILKFAADTLATLSKPSVLYNIGFTLPDKSSMLENDLDKKRLTGAKEDSFASDMGFMALSLVGHRLRRLSFLVRGWPGRAAAMLLKGDLGSEVLQELKKDYEAFIYFKTQENQPKVDAILKRSCFNTVACQQLVALAETNEWTLSAPFRKWLKDANYKVAVTQPIEDGFHHQKFKVDKQNSHRAREQRAYGTLLEKQVLTQRHRFDEIDPKPTVQKRGEKLSSSAFRPALRDCSLESASDVIGVTEHSRTTWWSPNVEGLPVPDYDLSLMRYCQDSGQAAEIGEAWQGFLVRAKHRLLVRRVQDGNPGEWHFAITDVPNSACLVWPAVQKQIPNSNGKVYFELDLSVRNINSCVMPVVSLASIEAWSYDWLSPLGLAMKYGDLGPQTRENASVKACAIGQPGPLLKVAAERGFWDLGTTALHMLAKSAGIDIRSSTPFDMAMGLVQGILEVDEPRALEILAQRFGYDTTACAPELLELDEAADLLDRDERQECQRQQSDAKKARERFLEFEGAWQKKQKAVAKAVAKAEAKKKRKKSSDGAAQSASQGPIRLPRGVLTHDQLKPMVPKGGYLWRNNYSGGWEAHFPSWPRVSYSWSAWGTRRSAIMCLRYLWGKWAIKNGKEISEVPIKGLWDDAQCDETLPASRASSSNNAS